MSRSLVLVAVIATALPLHAESPRPGRTAEGFLLPNGWRITPAGKQVETADLPLNIIPLADGKRALVACSGFNRHELLLIDLAESKIAARGTAFQSWFGLALNKAEDKVWWAGGGADMLHIFSLQDGILTRTSKPDLNITRLSLDQLEKLPDTLKKKKNFKAFGISSLPRLMN